MMMRIWICAAITALACLLVVLVPMILNDQPVAQPVLWVRVQVLMGLSGVFPFGALMFLAASNHVDSYERENLKIDVGLTLFYAAQCAGTLALQMISPP